MRRPLLVLVALLAAVPAALAGLPVAGADVPIVVINGRGFGHGVGMCQWCAEARARAGMRHEDILLAAYPGARLLRAY